MRLLDESKRLQIQYLEADHEGGIRAAESGCERREVFTCEQKCVELPPAECSLCTQKRSLKREGENERPPSGFLSKPSLWSGVTNVNNDFR